MRPVQRRTDVAFLSPDPDTGAFFRQAQCLADGFQELGLTYDAVFVRGSTGILRRGNTRVVCLGAPSIRRALPALFRYMRQARPRLLVAKPAHLVPFVLLVGRLAGCVVVPWEVSIIKHDYPFLDRRLQLLRVLRKWTYRSAPAFVVPCEDVASALRQELRYGRFVHVPNPIDAHGVRGMAGAGHPDPGMVRLCAVGRLTHQKGFDVLLKALGKLAPSLPHPWELVVVGKGPDHQKLRAYAAQLGIGERVTFTGHMANPYPIMACSDVFVHAARWEGFGNVIAEALALGVPVVASRCPGAPREILADGTYGVLVAPDDADELATAILQLLFDKERRVELQERGPLRAAQFSPRLVAARFHELSRDVGR